jgi:protein-tyrosine phosphatase
MLTYDRNMEFGERLVPFETCFNFRDIGGYETIDGRHVRWGSVFRSDTLHRLTTTDLERALELGIRTVIDLRSTDELTEWGAFPRTDDVDFHHLPLFEHGEPQVEPFDHDDPEPPVGEMYVQMATAGRDALAASLRVIAEGEHAVVFHCAAGKDRTGILAALLLTTLGVPDEVIVADYEISEHALAPSFAWAEANDAAMATVLANLAPWQHRSSPERMQVILDTLRTLHGSIDGYLTDAGLEPELFALLRDRLLEP